MAFEARLTSPTGQEKWWKHTSQGGLNPCILIANGSTIPNCVGYAFGRFSEILGEKAKLPTNNAGLWYDSCTAYEKGKEPKLGAVVVWKEPGQPGHVAVVEKINEDKSLVISQSGYNYKMFWTQTLYPPDYKCGSSYILQGFIYNPKVNESNKLLEYIQCANKYVGHTLSYIQKKTGMKKDKNWSCAFVVAVAKEVGGILSKVLDSSTSISKCISDSIEKGYGSFKKGPYYNRSITPQPGDLILFRPNNKTAYKDAATYYADEIGIVAEIKDESVLVISGDTSYNGKDNVCGAKKCKISFQGIFGYYRPKWSKVGGTVVDNYSTSGYVNDSYAPLYETESTEEDCLIREVAYFDNKEITTKKIDIKIGVINYTGGLSLIAEALGITGTTSNQPTVLDSTKLTDASKLPSNARNIFNYLTEKGLTTPQAVGVLANIRAESGYSPSAVNASSGASGICQWLGGRKTAMITQCGSNWKNNLTGQLDYLWKELHSGESAAYKELVAVSGDTVEAAKKAMEIFCSKFERPAKIGSVALNKELVKRAKYVEEIWDKLIIVSNSTDTALKDTNSNMTNQKGQKLTKAKQIVVPSDIKQTGVIANYTNYSYWYSRWNNTSNQRKVADAWNAAHRPSLRGIATLNGYYLVALSQQFGVVGDVLKIILEDGTEINAMLADAKRYTDANSSTWGHLMNGKVDIIEWEMKGSENSSVDSSAQSKMDLTGWKGKSVLKIINYGSFF